MAKQNIEKSVPKGNIKFSITLSEEQKIAKQSMLHHPYNFIVVDDFIGDKTEVRKLNLQ